MLITRAKISRVALTLLSASTIIAVGLVGTAGASSTSDGPHALVLSVHATPAQLPSSGGNITIIGNVEHADSCQLQLLTRQSFPVIFASNIRPCSSTFTARIFIGTSSSLTRRTVVLALVARNNTSSFTGRVYVSLAAYNPPLTAVLSAYATPRLLGPSGGTVTVSGRIKNAKTCQLQLLSRQSFSVIYADNARPCSSRFAAQITIGPNTTRARRAVAFALVARNGRSAFTGRFYVSLAAGTVNVAPITTTTTTPSPTTTTTTTPPAIATPVPLLSPQTQYSPNWSGYVATSGPYTGISGTFVVPALTTATTCSEMTAEWVGLDGTAGKALIQAGVLESPVNPSTGKCTPGHFYAWAWWEILPALSTPIAMTPTAGDRMAVNITRQPDGNWSISVVDKTNRQSFSTVQPYSGPGTTAEWVVEAPIRTDVCGTGIDPSAQTGICPLAPYQPSVQFSGLLTAGHTTGILDVIMSQHGHLLSTPSTLSAGGFTIAYGNSATSTATGTVNRPRRQSVLARASAASVFGPTGPGRVASQNILP